MGQLEKMMDINKSEEVNSYVARCIYARNISFNVVRSPYQQDMVKAMNDGPKGYKSPSFEKLPTTLLTKERSLVELTIEPIRTSCRTTSVSIIFDGWTNARSKPLINVIVVSPNGSMFLNVVDCKGELKDAPFIANIFINAIESVGPSNVMQIIINNARVCKATELLVEARYKHIFWTPCVVHSLNLILKKIGNIEWMEITDKSKEIEMFITNLLTIRIFGVVDVYFYLFFYFVFFKTVETQFTSNFIMLRRLLEVKSSLCKMVISNV
eukprot:Gb_30342 [translate_table: standard]